MKIQHTPIKTEKVGKKWVVSCKFLPEGWKLKPIEYEQSGNTEEESRQKAMAFLGNENNELEEVETL